MSIQEILSEIQKLPVLEQRKLLDTLTFDGEIKAEISLEETDRQLQEKLLGNGLLSEIKSPRSSLPKNTFQPIVVSGEPVSETIIREHR